MVRKHPSSLLPKQGKRAWKHENQHTDWVTGWYGNWKETGIHLTRPSVCPGGGMASPWRTKDPGSDRRKVAIKRLTCVEKGRVPMVTVLYQLHKNDGRGVQRNLEQVRVKTVLNRRRQKQEGSTVQVESCFQCQQEQTHSPCLYKEEIWAKSVDEGWVRPVLRGQNSHSEEGIDVSWWKPPKKYP